MRVVVTGASGNIGTTLLRRLRFGGVERVTGVARRPPPASSGGPYDRAGWRSLDTAGAGAVEELTAVFRGADAVVHLAWRIVGGHDRATQERVNRTGSRQVVQAVLRSGVPRLVHLSSAAVYSPGPGGAAVEESWPRRDRQPRAAAVDAGHPPHWIALSVETSTGSGHLGS
jgi:nucleoside-diphosphate-sugar epimerase